jgi:hypothetical protein
MTQEGRDMMIKMIDRIDWDLLSSQKQWLAQQAEHSDEAEGLLNVIDTLQDWAVDVAGLSEEEVFGEKVDD